MTLIGLPNWQPVQGEDILFLLIYASISILSHWLLLKCYEVAEASSVQPFAYLQIVFVSIIGMTIYDETLAPAVVIGTALIVAAGIYALWHSRTIPKVPLR
jgi:drug/metabolite transporter (DMT)-like permease